MSPSLVHQILAITHPYVEYLEENITKWYILVPGILIVLNVLTTLHTKYLEYKFNAKACHKLHSGLHFWCHNSIDFDLLQVSRYSNGIRQ